VKIEVSLSGSNDRAVTYVTMTGEFTTKAGTLMDVYFVDSEDIFGYRYPNTSEFHSVLKSKGFDREGNPVDGQCNMTYFPMYDYVKLTVEVANAKTSKVIEKLTLNSKYRIF
jgi:hypothetical protein